MDRLFIHMNLEDQLMKQKIIQPPVFDRRNMLIGGASLSALALSGCGVPGLRNRVDGDSLFSGRQNYTKVYGALPNEQFPLPAVKLSQVNRRFLRRRVKNRTGEAPGTVVVDINNYFLFWTEEGGTAMRYGVGLGRAGFEWSGRGKIRWKQEWPKWTPPAEMIAREPELAKWSADNGGMPPGLKNPLGARALYIFQGNVDTLYRLHGTLETWSIGKAVSSGCVRLLNHDVIDLYDRVPSGSRIVVQ